MTKVLLPHNLNFTKLMQLDISHLRRLLSQQIIPHLASGNLLRSIIAQRPLHIPSGVNVARRAAPSLTIDRNNRSDFFFGKYPQEGVHAIRHPYLCYVVQGEIDMRLAIPAQRGKTRDVAKQYEILSLPAHSALLIPPGVFFPDSNYSYWERSGRSPETQIFWTHILPDGVFCHTGAIDKSIYRSDFITLFIPGQSFAAIIDLLQESMTAITTESALMTQGLFLALFSRVLWKLGDGTPSPTPDHEEGRTVINPKSTSRTVKRAREFIHKSKNISFGVADVAAYAYVSPAHLMRLFHTEMNMTIMEYATQQRLAVAESWLKNSEMPVKQIAGELGYSQAPQFSRAFKRVYGVSPVAFRKQNYTDKK